MYLTTKVYDPPPMPENVIDPNAYDLTKNNTPFGAILRGQASAHVLAESITLLSFQDRSPRANFHALIIPKYFIATVHELTSADLPLLYEMKTMADQLTIHHKVENCKLVFHVPPYHSVNHLHLHVLDRDSLDMIGRWKYDTETRYCTEWQTVVQRLEQNDPPTRFCGLTKSKTQFFPFWGEE